MIEANYQAFQKKTTLKTKQDYNSSSNLTSVSMEESVPKLFFLFTLSPS